jgi:hypothetical protein
MMKISTTRSPNSLSSSSLLSSFGSSPSPNSPSLSRRFKFEEVKEDAFPRTCSHLPSKVSGYQYFLIIPHWDTVQLLDSVLPVPDSNGHANGNGNHQEENSHFFSENGHGGENRNGHGNGHTSNDQIEVRPKLLMFRDSLTGSDTGGDASWHLPVIFFEKQPYFRVPAIIKAAQEKWNLKIKLTLNLEESYDPVRDYVQLVYLVDVGELKTKMMKSYISKIPTISSVLLCIV